MNRLVQEGVRHSHSFFEKKNLKLETSGHGAIAFAHGASPKRDDGVTGNPKE